MKIKKPRSINPKIVFSTIPLRRPKAMPPRTRIICTVAPLNAQGKVAKDEPIDKAKTKERVEMLLEEGMGVVRVNFSHVNNEIRQQNVWTLIEIVRQVSKEKKRPIGILMDLCGPRLRIGTVREEPRVWLQKGQQHVLTTVNKDLVGNEEKCYVTYRNFARDIKSNLDDKRLVFIFINDGKVKLKAKHANENEVICEVVESGELESDKGINIPNIAIGDSAYTRKDKEDLEWIFSQEKKRMNEDKDFRAVDYVALSFVKDRRDIIALKGALDAEGKFDIPIIAKMETAECVEQDNMMEIFEELGSENGQIDQMQRRATGALMVARGDLAVETRHEAVPHLQTTMIRESNARGMPVIVATEMLDSMFEKPTPTRAEVVDVVNAVRENADMVMLSRETASGAHPDKATRMMATILSRAESENIVRTEIKEDAGSVRRWRYRGKITTTKAIAGPACEMARLLVSPAIVVCSATGETARRCASFRPNQPIIAITMHRNTAMNLLLHRGIYPVLIRYKPKGTEKLLGTIESILERLRIGRKDELVVCTFAAETSVKYPLSTYGELRTNIMYILRIKEDYAGEDTGLVSDRKKRPKTRK